MSPEEVKLMVAIAKYLLMLGFASGVPAKDRVPAENCIMEALKELGVDPEAL
jgi:hypothetical protein